MSNPIWNRVDQFDSAIRKAATEACHHFDGQYVAKMFEPGDGTRYCVALFAVGPDHLNGRPDRMFLTMIDWAGPAVTVELPGYVLDGSPLDSFDLQYAWRDAVGSAVSEYDAEVVARFVSYLLEEANR